jgi:hypothetical protein
VWRVQAPAVIVTGLLTTAFFVGLGAFLLLGSPELLAAP